MTDCAWTSAFTGLNPGSHGIFGSWYRAPGAYECRYFSSRDRLAPPLWDLASDRRFLVWNVPMTYPPSLVNGVMVAGYGAPPGTRYCAPLDFQDELERRWPPEDLLDRAPHGSLEEFREDLLRGLGAQAAALPWAAERAEAECVVAVWPHVDRAQHFFWKMRDTENELAGAVDDVYEAMDRATGALVEAWPDADFLVVSDHGAGPLHGDVNLGAWLAQKGYASFGKSRRLPLVDLAWKLPPSIRQLGRRVAPAMARKAMSATLTGQLGAFKWSETRAFLGFHSDLWLNLEGREPEGSVAESEADELLDEIADELLALRDPRSDAPVFAAAHKRADVYSGPAFDLAPDLILDSWSAGYRVAPKRQAADEIVGPPHQLAGVEESWSSDHRPLGIFAAAGPNIYAGETGELSLYDVCPTALALLGAPVPEGLDGRVAEEAIAPEFLSRHPIRTGEGKRESAGGGEYSEEEAAAVAAHLKDLGYID
jgi:predicted AlkP superfamily phosphohydrolase/phosphomutase